MNYGLLMGWSATHGAVDWTTLAPMYAGSVAWTVLYDTIYAYQDRADDAALGLKSTALWIGDRSKSVLSGVAAAAVLGWTATGLLAGLAWPFYVGVGASAAHLAWQVRTMDVEDRLNLTRRFVSNQWVGAAVLAGAVAGRLLQ
jgi:4-hydroxybenzoate polyprenyltransferase